MEGIFEGMMAGFITIGIIIGLLIAGLWLFSNIDISWGRIIHYKPVDFPVRAL